MLLLIFAMVLLGLFAIFLGGGWVAQGYLYQAPADRFVLRSLLAAGLVATFITLWVAIDRRAPGRYDTFFNFTPYSTVEIQEFEAIRWLAVGGQLKLDSAGNPIETTVRFQRSLGGKGSQFLEDGTGKPFTLQGSTSSGTQYLTAALRIRGPNDPEPVRYNALLKDGTPKNRPEYAPERRFVEEKGSRYVEVHKLDTVLVPSTAAVAAALFINFVFVVVWVVAFWPIMRFSISHALVFAGSFAVLTMLTLMPVLFKHMREAEASAAPAAVTRRATGFGPAPFGPDQWLRLAAPGYGFSGLKRRRGQRGKPVRRTGLGITSAWGRTQTPARVLAYSVSPLPVT